MMKNFTDRLDLTMKMLKSNLYFMKGRRFDVFVEGLLNMHIKIFVNKTY